MIRLVKDHRSKDGIYLTV